MIFVHNGDENSNDYSDKYELQDNKQNDTVEFCKYDVFDTDLHSIMKMNICSDQLYTDSSIHNENDKDNVDTDGLDEDEDSDIIESMDEYEYFEANHLDDDEVEIIELEDESGNVEEFIIFEEFNFDSKRFAIVAPLVEVQAKRNDNQEISAADFDGLNIGVLEVCGNHFAIIEDELYVKNLLVFLDEMSINAGDE